MGFLGRAGRKSDESERVTALVAEAEAPPQGAPPFGTGSHGSVRIVIGTASGPTSVPGTFRFREERWLVGQPPLALDTYAGNFHTGSSHVDARAFLTVQVPRSARYRIVTSGRSSQPINASAPRIVLGVPIGGRIPRLVGAGLIALLAFVGLCFVVPAAWGRVRS